MFPTTVWTTIRQAAGSDEEARDRFARLYRAPVLRFLRARGFGAEDAEDLCQDVFVRLFKSRLLERADKDKGRFRSLLLTVTKRVGLDRLRKRPDAQLPEAEVEDEAAPAATDEEFDREWAVLLVERALERLRRDESPYFAVLQNHLAGAPAGTRNQLWIARRKLVALIRHEVALTCGSNDEFEDEIAYLSGFLRPSLQKN